LKVDAEFFILEGEAIVVSPSPPYDLIKVDFLLVSTIINVYLPGDCICLAFDFDADLAGVSP